MPGTIIHLLIAKKLKDLYPIDDYSMFVAGSIAPDAIHAKPGYVRDDKRRSHLRLGIRDAHFHQEEKLSLFKSRVQEFKDNNCNKGDLYLGYLCHVMADELFVLSVRREYTTIRSAEGLHFESSDFYKPMIREMEEMDKIMYIRHDLDLEKELLESVSNYEVEGYIPTAYLDASRAWVLDHKLKTHKSLNTKYITEERIEAFINQTVETLVARLLSESLY